MLRRRYPGAGGAIPIEERGVGHLFADPAQGDGGGMQQVDGGLLLTVHAHVPEEAVGRGPVARRLGRRCDQRGRGYGAQVQGDGLGHRAGGGPTRHGSSGSATSHPQGSARRAPQRLPVAARTGFRRLNCGMDWMIPET
jgi:hypothetical protein